MLVARFRIEELFVHQREFGAAVHRAQFQRHQRFALGRALPCPGVEQLAVDHDFPVGAAHIMHLAVGRLHTDVIAAADANVGLGDRAF